MRGNTNIWAEVTILFFSTLIYVILRGIKYEILWCGRGPSCTYIGQRVCQSVNLLLVGLSVDRQVSLIVVQSVYQSEYELYVPSFRVLWVYWSFYQSVCLLTSTHLTLFGQNHLWTRHQYSFNKPARKWNYSKVFGQWVSLIQTYWSSL